MFVNYFRFHLMLFLVLTFFGCNSHDNNITLKEWYQNQQDFEDFLTVFNKNGCDTIKKIINKLTIEEFKVKTFNALIDCFNTEEQQKEYLTKKVAYGLHPSRIDSLKYSNVYNEIKQTLEKSHKEFWRDKDTSYFMEIENRVFLDRIYNERSIVNPTESNFKIRDSVFKDNAGFLLSYCHKHGFPFQPYPSHFKQFRSTVSPLEIAIHAPIEYKLKLLDFAKESAYQGKISWYIPIGINVTIFTNAPQQRNLHPLWLIYFNEKWALDMDQSYLQLYSIKKLYNQDMKRKIRIQSSKYMGKNKEVINRQLNEIKNALINEFSFDPNYISISSVPDSSEQDQRNIAPYEYTLSIIE